MMDFKLFHILSIISLKTFKMFALINLFVTGNVVNGTIGKQMVDTLVESSGNVEVK